MELAQKAGWDDSMRSKFADGTAMADTYDLTQWVAPAASCLEILGILVILGAVALATLTFAREWRIGDHAAAYLRYRANLGRGILLGLEILVGADIISTVTAPLTWESVGLLGLIVMIRTLLSFSLEVEIEGRWPWRRNNSTDN